MIRFATIGTNFITDKFVEAAGMCDGLEISGVYSRTEATARAFAAKYGILAAFTDLKSLAESGEIDAVYIASPTSFHAEQAKEMMRHGKHVLCEKPAASNSKELKELLALAKENGVIFLEAVRPVFTPCFQAIQGSFENLGTIRRASLQFCQYSSRYDRFKEGIVENAFNPAFSNGALMDIGVYCVHSLVKLFGRPQEIWAAGVILENGIDGAGTILAKYPRMQAELIYSKIANSKVLSQIQGEKGCLTYSQVSIPEEAVICYNDGREEIVFDRKEKNNMVYEIREFLRLIGNREDGKEHHLYSEWTMEILDEARKQMKIVFPADCG